MLIASCSRWEGGRQRKGNLILASKESFDEQRLEWFWTPVRNCPLSSVRLRKRTCMVKYAIIVCFGSMCFRFEEIGLARFVISACGRSCAGAYSCAMYTL